MPVDQSVIEIAAKAIYAHQVKTAREEIDKLTFDPSEVIEFANRLLGESETAQVILFYTFLDNVVRTLLSLQMVGLDTNTAKEELFEGHGPLATFSARTRIAYHLGWISARQKVRLDAFRKVRNEFAHRAYKVTIADSVVADKLKLIDYDLVKLLGDHLEPATYHLSGLSSLLCRLIQLARITCEELLVYPAARAHRVSARDINASFDEAPELMRNVSRAFAHALIVAGGVKELEAPPEAK